MVASTAGQMAVMKAVWKDWLMAVHLVYLMAGMMVASKVVIKVEMMVGWKVA